MGKDLVKAFLSVREPYFRAIWTIKDYPTAISNGYFMMMGLNENEKKIASDGCPVLVYENQYKLKLEFLSKTYDIPLVRLNSLSKTISDKNKYIVYELHFFGNSHNSHLVYIQTRYYDMFRQTYPKCQFKISLDYSNYYSNYGGSVQVESNAGKVVGYIMSLSAGMNI